MVPCCWAAVSTSLRSTAPSAAWGTVRGDRLWPGPFRRTAVRPQIAVLPELSGGSVGKHWMLAGTGLLPCSRGLLGGWSLCSRLEFSLLTAVLNLSFLSQLIFKIGKTSICHTRQPTIPVRQCPGSAQLWPPVVAEGPELPTGATLSLWHPA